MTRVILEGGYFTADDTSRVAFILLGYAPAIWAYSMVHVFTRAFYARGESMTPVRIALLMVGFNLLLNVTLIWTPLREAGLAWSTAICAVIQAGLLGRALRGRTGPLLDRDVLASWGRTGVAVLVMTAAVAGVTMAWPWTSETWSGALALLGGQVAAGAFVFTLAAALLRMAELRWLLHRGSAPDSGPGVGRG
jgi:putative peptidoglycan lipid II flippase